LQVAFANSSLPLNEYPLPKCLSQLHFAHLDDRLMSHVLLFGDTTCKTKSHERAKALKKTRSTIPNLNLNGGWTESFDQQ
jgi:hypothetical protein